jgi:hypothetical protein
MNEDELRRAYARHLASARQSRAGCPGPDALAALAQQRGDEGQRLATLDHAMSCVDCRRDLELLRSVMAAGKRLEPTARGVTAWPWRLAAAAGLVLAVGGVATVALRERGETVFRGGALEVALVSPEGSVAPAPALTLTWRRTPGATGYQVELVGARGDSIYAAATPDTSLILPTGVVLEAGQEYLWTVRARLADRTQVGSTPLRFRIQP